MTLFVALQSGAAASMTSCCILGISGLSCVAASVLAVTLRAEDLVSAAASPLGKGPPAEMLRLLSDAPMVQLFGLALGADGASVLELEKSRLPLSATSAIFHTFTRFIANCV